MPNAISYCAILVYRRRTRTEGGADGSAQYDLRDAKQKVQRGYTVRYP